MTRSETALRSTASSVSIRVSFAQLDRLPHALLGERVFDAPVDQVREQLGPCGRQAEVALDAHLAGDVPHFAAHLVHRRAQPNQLLTHFVFAFVGALLGGRGQHRLLGLAGGDDRALQVVRADGWRGDLGLQWNVGLGGQGTRVRRGLGQRRGHLDLLRVEQAVADLSSRQDDGL
jgi:hypothetical protein